MKRATTTFDSVRFLRRAITNALLREQREAASLLCPPLPAGLCEQIRRAIAETRIPKRRGARGE